MCKKCEEWCKFADSATEEQLVENGDAFKCPCCDGLNIYSPYLVDRFPEAGIATGSSFETICGLCHTHYVSTDSPLLAEVYTHVDPSEYDNEYRDAHYWV